MDDDAAYSVYDLLRALIDRVGWPTEEEKRAAMRSVDMAEMARVFGDVAVQMVCPHHEDDRDATGLCRACGRQIETPQSLPRPGTPRSGNYSYW